MSFWPSHSLCLVTSKGASVRKKEELEWEITLPALCPRVDQVWPAASPVPRTLPAPLPGHSLEGEKDLVWLE